MLSAGGTHAVLFYLLDRHALLAMTRGEFCVVLYLRKLILATASRPKYLLILFFISFSIYDNCNVNAGFAGRRVILNRPSRIFLIAANFATPAISGPMILSHRAAKSASDARMPKICNSSPIAPPMVPGRALRFSNFLFRFDICVFFGHQDIHFSH